MYTFPRTRRTAAGAVAVAAGMLATGCGADGHPAASGAVSASTTASAPGTATPSAADPAAATTGATPSPTQTPASAASSTSATLSGTRLRSVLTPLSFLPSTYTVVPKYTEDSGTKVQSAVIVPAENRKCTTLLATAWETYGGWGDQYAEAAFVTKANDGLVSEVVDAYADPSMAAQEEQAFAGIAKSCASWTETDTISGTTGKVTYRTAEQKLAGVGDEAYLITVSSTQLDLPTTLATVRVGSAVAGVSVTARSGEADTARRVIASIAAKLKAAG